MKARYLTFFSYIGTGFRSSQKQWLKAKQNYPDPESVQGLMELALLKFKSLNYPHLTLSSRTDGGVHALNSSAHFDLERFGTNIYDANNLTYQMNKFFFKNNISIYVKQCLRVSDNFSARYNAKSRTYLYRFAILKDDIELPENTCITSVIPIEEWRRCHFMRIQDFNIEKLKEGAKYLIGYHDFTTFKKFDKLKQYKHNRRELYSVEARRSKAVVSSYTEAQDSYFNYWEIEFKGRSFVHNQIRRMVGALLSVAIGKLPPEEIKVMLQIPSKHSWYSFITTCPPHGLYLCNVEYNQQDLTYSDDVNTECKKESDYSDCE